MAPFWPEPWLGPGQNGLFLEGAQSPGPRKYEKQVSGAL